jgi:hypothetical protein
MANITEVGPIYSDPILLPGVAVIEPPPPPAIVLPLEGPIRSFNGPLYQPTFVYATITTGGTGAE